MTTKEFLEQEASKFGFKIGEGFFGDVELYPTERAVTELKLVELWTMLDGLGFEVASGVDRSGRGMKLMIRAPHVKQHFGDKHRGLNCTHGMSIKVCDTLHRCDSSIEELQTGIL